MTKTYRADWLDAQGQVQVRDFGTNKESAQRFARRKSAKPDGGSLSCAGLGSSVYVIVAEDGVDVGQWPYFGGQADGFESA